MFEVGSGDLFTEIAHHFSGHPSPFGVTAWNDENRLLSRHRVYSATEVDHFYGAPPRPSRVASELRTVRCSRSAGGTVYGTPPQRMFGAPRGRGFAFVRGSSTGMGGCTVSRRHSRCCGSGRRLRQRLHPNEPKAQLEVTDPCRLFRRAAAGTARTGEAGVVLDRAVAAA